MKKKILIIICIIVILSAIVGGIIIYKNIVKPLVTWNGSVGDWMDSYRLEIQIYENGKCKLIGSEIGQIVSFKVEKNKVKELQRKIDELKFRDISEHIKISAMDYPNSSITVNYKDKQSHMVFISAGTKSTRKGEKWEFNSYEELSKEIRSLVPEEKQNEFETKIKKKRINK